MMANLNERDRKALRFGGIGVGIVVFLLVVGFPVLDYWDRLNRDVDDAQKKLVAIESGFGDAAEASLTMEALRKVATIHASPSGLNRQTAAMQAQIERLPGYRTLTVQRIEDLALREEDKVHRSAIQLQFSGTLPGLQQFLRDMESSQPSLKVDRLTLSTEGKDPRRIEGQLVISAFAVVLQKGKNG
jgi:hypothetical protein